MNLEEYLEELANSSARLRVSELVRLSHLTPEQAQALAAVWPTVEARRRRRVMGELVELAEDNVDLSFDAVFFAGLEDEDAEVRLQAVRGLWEYEGGSLIGPLVRMMEGDEEAVVREEAALALGRFVLLAAYGKLRERYFKQLEAALQRVMEDADEVEEVRARALEAIGPHNSAWVRQAIREAYENGVHRVKVSALHAMGRSCEGGWLPLLLRELSSEEPEIRYEAALACGSLGDERVLSHLVPLLEDSDQEVKEATIAAVGEIGGQQAKNLLLGLADDPSPSVREAALQALAEMDFEEDPLSFGYGV